MKTKTIEILDHMLARSEERMVEEGWKDHEVQAFLNDPIIKLFYGACAEELEQVYEEIYHVERRLINRTIESLLPEEFQLPRPAHAIMRAQPIKKVEETRIWPECQFVIRKGNRGKELTFAPAGTFRTMQAEIDYLVFRDRFYRISEGNRIQIIGGDSSNAFQDDVLWLGIKDLNKVLPKDEIAIFFAMPQALNEQSAFFNALRFCKCSTADGTPIKMSQGINSQQNEFVSYKTSHSDQIVYQLFQTTRDWYQKYFATLHDLTPKTANTPPFPSDFKSRFPGHELDKITDDIFWIKLSFSNMLNERWIHLLYTSINCFPVVNLKLEQKLFEVEETYINIYPIVSDDFIMAITSIGGKIRSREEELNYTLVDPDLRSAVGKEGEAIFRRGSLGRITSQKLKGMLNHLLNLLKEEIVLLTKDGSKEDIDKLNRLNKATIDFEKVIEIEQEKKGKYSGSVLLKAFKDQTKVYVRYWTTSGEDANQIKPLSGDDGQKQCDIVFAPDTGSESLRLLTTSLGGKKEPSDEEYIDTLRRLLLTRNRIVTSEDIKVFCYEYFHPRNVKVNVRKTVKQSQRAGQGLERVLEISILLGSHDYSMAELDFLKEELLLKLEQHAANVLPFYIEFV
jgi:hypothetical protein